MRHVIVAGLTASGKTTHCRHVAAVTGLEYVSGSAIRSRLFGDSFNGADDPKFWRTEQAEVLDTQRVVDMPPVDLEVEEELIRLARESQGAVFDTWVLPWLYRDDSLCVYLRNPASQRARRVADSTDPETLRAAEKRIERKDWAAAEFFRRAYGVDIIRDMSPFDVILESDDHRDILPADSLHATSEWMAQIATSALAGDGRGIRRLEESLTKDRGRRIKIWISESLKTRVSRQDSS